MEKYKVMLYPRAFRDIDGIYAYIALEKLAPENTKGQTDRIWAAIESLASFHQRIRIVRLEDMPEEVMYPVSLSWVLLRLSQTIFLLSCPPHSTECVRSFTV
jgi:plasmid stabilization system protein ParE